MRFPRSARNGAQAAHHHGRIKRRSVNRRRARSVRRQRQPPCFGAKPGIPCSSSREHPTDADQALSALWHPLPAPKAGPIRRSQRGFKHQPFSGPDRLAHVSQPSGNRSANNLTAAPSLLGERASTSAISAKWRSIIAHSNAPAAKRRRKRLGSAASDEKACAAQIGQARSAFDMPVLCLAADGRLTSQHLIAHLLSRQCFTCQRVGRVLCRLLGGHGVSCILWLNGVQQSKQCLMVTYESNRHSTGSLRRHRRRSM